jgi:menaquinone reductase, multiheme cytochrome c subunit
MSRRLPTRRAFASLRAGVRSFVSSRREAVTPWGAFVAGALVALGFGWLALPRLLYQRIEQPLQFSHALHTGEAVGQSCEDCHAFDTDGRFAGIPSIESCAACHSETLGDSENERRLVEDYVKKGREIPWLVYSRQPDTAFFPHTRHLRVAELPCARCHGPHGGTTTLRAYERNRLTGYSRDVWGRRLSGVATADWDGMKMGDCSRCHRQRDVAESCLDCHR